MNETNERQEHVDDQNELPQALSLTGSTKVALPGWCDSEPILDYLLDRASFVVTFPGLFITKQDGRFSITNVNVVETQSLTSVEMTELQRVVGACARKKTEGEVEG